MDMFIGIVVTLVIVVLALRFVAFVLRTGRRATRDLSDYSHGRPIGTTQSRAQHRSVRPAGPKPTFTQAELDYFAAHVPASAGRQRPLKGAGRIDLRNTTEKDR